MVAFHLEADLLFVSVVPNNNLILVAFLGVAADDSFVPEIEVASLIVAFHVPVLPSCDESSFPGAFQLDAFQEGILDRHVDPCLEGNCAAFHPVAVRTASYPDASYQHVDIVVVRIPVAPSL